MAATHAISGGGWQAERRRAFLLGLSPALVVLLLITLSYSNLGRRHVVVEEHADPHRQHPNKHDHGQGH